MSMEGASATNIKRAKMERNIILIYLLFQMRAYSNKKKIFGLLVREIRIPSFLVVSIIRKLSGKMGTLE